MASMQEFLKINLNPVDVPGAKINPNDLESCGNVQLKRLLECRVMNVPGVKPYFNIPERIQHSKDFNSAAKKPLIKRIKDKWKNAKLQDEMKQKQKINSKIFKEAGSAPIPKTYSVDLTGGKGKSTKTAPSWPW